MCVTQKIVEQTKTRILEQIGKDLPKEHESCDPNEEVDLCAANHEADCLARALPDTQCYPSLPNSPVKCVKQDDPNQGICLRKCIKGCVNGDVCDGEYCVPEK